jgi:hypothetical protein
MRTAPIRAFLALILTLGSVQVFATATGSRGTQAAARPGVTLVYLSARSMTEEERTRWSKDYLGADSFIRLRIEVLAERGVQVLAPGNGSPLGYTLDRFGGKVVWSGTHSGEDRSKSPGAGRLIKEFGEGWLTLPARSAYEWEFVAESTEPGHEEAASIFVRQSSGAEPLEVISPWYTTRDSAHGTIRQ